jgi:hypothetical protein
MGLMQWAERVADTLMAAGCPAGVVRVELIPPDAASRLP